MEELSQHCWAREVGQVARPLCPCLTALHAAALARSSHAQCRSAMMMKAGRLAQQQARVMGAALQPPGDRPSICCYPLACHPLWQCHNIVLSAQRFGCIYHPWGIFASCCFFLFKELPISILQIKTVVTVKKIKDIFELCRARCSLLPVTLWLSVQPTEKACTLFNYHFSYAKH